MEWNQEEKKLIRCECMQCSVKRHALLCHDITAFSDPAHADEIITKSLKVMGRVKDPCSRSVKRNTYTRPVSRFWLIQGIKLCDPAKSPPLPKGSLIIRDWTKDCMGHSIFKEVFENLKSKDDNKDRIYTDYSLDGGETVDGG